MSKDISELCAKIKWKPIDTGYGATKESYLSSNEELTAIECFLQEKLPDDYLWFMKNVGRRLIDDKRINIKLNGVSLSFLDWFRDAVDVLTFTQMASEKEEEDKMQTSFNLVVISSSISHDEVLLDVSAGHYGNIWFKHHNPKWRQKFSENPEGLVLIANSFTDLFSKIVNNHFPGEIDFNFDDDDEII
ncbi:SMI1/KNR4 family protein [Shewanella woodyi]|uniref:SMI1/KNR4 family protein n=1 Tax=Shewanella woodyi TaxID=60961 RepID=UPI0007F888AE|nr:SMI1/KNR4 family protein [Shewanella woodyi]